MSVASASPSGDAVVGARAATSLLLRVGPSDGLPTPWRSGPANVALVAIVAAGAGSATRRRLGLRLRSAPGGRRAATALVAVPVLAVSCSSGRSSSAARSSSIPAYRPVFAPGPCNDEVPDDPRIECGTLTVPLDRSRVAGVQAKLAVAIVHSPPGVAKQPDPVVYSVSAGQTRRP